jgi:lysyl-tRNA synthetase class 1
MLWCEKVAAQANPDIPHIINDSKTPSGRVHVGALRGVLIHDAVFRCMKDRGLDVTYKFGVDDYDPVDEIPYGEAEHFEQHLGKPLCDVPPPPGSTASDMANHFIAEFFDIFDELDVKVERYHMRDVYRSGQFNEVIDQILQSGDLVRQIYYDVSKSEKSDKWIPFQTVCENCGRIGTTEVVGYDGKEVEYHCRPNMVSWARGCGHHGKMSPFDGNGKLPWKLEWVAKWHTFPVTVEGAGKDHSTKGGSRDVSAACLRRIFRGKPPINIPYEFFLIGGAKMSSSKGLGATARDMANFLPPEILRFLMLQTQPQRPVNFSPEEKSIIKLFNDFDRYHSRTYNDPKISEEDKHTYFLAAGDHARAGYDANFQMVTTIVQMPHLDLEAEIAKQKGSKLDEWELGHLKRRASSAQYWVDNFAAEDEKTILQEELPASAADLSEAQRGFLSGAAKLVANAEWTAEGLQAALFDAARVTPVQAGLAFKAIYCALLNRGDGPRAGNLLAFLDRDFVVKRLGEVTFDLATLWRETTISPNGYATWRSKNEKKLESVSGSVVDAPVDETAVEVTSILQGDRKHLHRLLFADSAAAEAFIATL